MSAIDAMLQHRYGFGARRDRFGESVADVDYTYEDDYSTGPFQELDLDSVDVSADGSSLAHYDPELKPWVMPTAVGVGAGLAGLGLGALLASGGRKKRRNKYDPRATEPAASEEKVSGIGDAVAAEMFGGDDDEFGILPLLIAPVAAAAGIGTAVAAKKRKNKAHHAEAKWGALKRSQARAEKKGDRKRAQRYQAEIDSLEEQIGPDRIEELEEKLDAFGAEDDDLDFELDMDDDEEAFGEDDEYGLLGIAVSDKAKAKKWAKKYVETNRRLVELKRAESRGADTVSRKKKGPFQRREVDVGKQISKLEEDQAKALREYRATKASKRNGKTMPPAVYLQSVGEDVDVAAASETRKKLATYGGRLGARGPVTPQASGGDACYEAASRTAREFPGSSIGFVFHGSGASKGSTGAFVSVPVRSSQEFAATKENVLRWAAMSGGSAGTNQGAMEWMNSAGPGGGYVTVIFRNYPARGVDGNAAEQAALRTIRAFPGKSAMAFVFFGDGAQRRSTGACASIPIKPDVGFDNTLNLALFQATMSAADAGSNPGFIEWMNTPGPGAGYVTLIFRN